MEGVSMTSSKDMKYYTKEEGKDRIICLLCRHSCKLKEGQVGVCGINKKLHLFKPPVLMP